MNPIRKFDLKALVASVIIFAIVQGLILAEVIGPFWELNIILICINIILAVSLNLINGYTGQFSIGHAGFMAVGAYTGAIITVKLGLLLDTFGMIIITVAVLIMLSVFISYRVARAIIKPINDIDLDNPDINENYEELGPLLHRIHQFSYNTMGNTSA